MTTTRLPDLTVVYDGELPAHVNITGLHHPACHKPDPSVTGRARAATYGDLAGRCTLAGGHDGDCDSAATWRAVAKVHRTDQGTVILDLGNSHGGQQMRLSPGTARELAGALLAASQPSAAQVGR